MKYLATLPCPARSTASQTAASPVAFRYFSAKAISSGRAARYQPWRVSLSWVPV